MKAMPQFSYGVHKGCTLGQKQLQKWKSKKCKWCLVTVESVLTKFWCFRCLRVENSRRFFLVFSYLSQRTGQIRWFSSRNAEMRLLSGPCPSDIAYFSVFFIPVCKLGCYWVFVHRFRFIIFEVIGVIVISAKKQFRIFGVYQFRKYFFGGYFSVIVGKY